MRSVQEQGNSSIFERYWGGWKENISGFSWGGVLATRGLWDGKLRGQSAEDAFRDTEVHKINQGR